MILASSGRLLVASGVPVLHEAAMRQSAIMRNPSVLGGKVYATRSLGTDKQSKAGCW